MYLFYNWLGRKQQFLCSPIWQLFSRLTNSKKTVYTIEHDSLPQSGVRVVSVKGHEAMSGRLVGKSHSQSTDQILAPHHGPVPVADGHVADHEGDVVCILPPTCLHR